MQIGTTGKRDGDVFMASTQFYVERWTCIGAVLIGRKGHAVMCSGSLQHVALGALLKSWLEDDGTAIEYSQRTVWCSALPT